MTIIQSQKHGARGLSYSIPNKNCNLITRVWLPLDGENKISINLSYCAVHTEELESQKSLISRAQVADLRPCGYACAQKLTWSGSLICIQSNCAMSHYGGREAGGRRTCTYEMACTVLTNKSRALISRSWAAGELPAGSKSLSLSFLAAGNARQVQTGSLSGSSRLWRRSEDTLLQQKDTEREGELSASKEDR